MTGNIIGQDFNSKLIDEINLRQKIHGSGFKKIEPLSKIQFLNNRKCLV